MIGHVEIFRQKIAYSAIIDYHHFRRRSHRRHHHHHYNFIDLYTDNEDTNLN